MARIFIDGSVGTTGLQIGERLAGRSDIELLRLAEVDRKNREKRREMLNAADIVILCLPDDAAREAVSLIDNPATRVIDASTAHRTSEGWTYGFPEYETDQREVIAGAARVANPGCYALASVAILHPLVRAGLMPSDWPVTINAISGYSGGGKGLIAAFENEEAENYTQSPFYAYGLGLAHKHVPEITRWSGLGHAPVFMPSVGRFAQGMLVQVPLPLWSLPGAPSPQAVHDCLAGHYAGQRFVSVVAAADSASMDKLEPEALNGTNELRLHVFGNPGSGQAVAMGLLDNLGKGAAGQAVQNLNIMTGVSEDEGLA